MVLPGTAALECRSSEQLQNVRAADLQNVNMAFVEGLIWHSHVFTSYAAMQVAASGDPSNGQLCLAPVTWHVLSSAQFIA